MRNKSFRTEIYLDRGVKFPLLELDTFSNLATCLGQRTHSEVNFDRALLETKWEKRMYVSVEGSGKAVENWKLS
jgi:hypothetical protein